MAPDIRYVRVAWNIDADRYSAHDVSPSSLPPSVYGSARAYTITVGSALYRVWNSGALFPFVSRDL